MSSLTRFHKANADQAADRQYRMYSGQMVEEISLMLSYPQQWNDNEPPLVEPQPDDDLVKERAPLCWQELPLMLEMNRRQVRRSLENPDDSLPAMNPAFCFEGGIETEMLGGKARYIGTRFHTYGEPVEPLIPDYREFDWQLPREENVWFQRFLQAYRFMAEHADGDVALAFQAGISAMNMAVQFRGAELAYADIYENPSELRRLLDYALDFNLYLFGRVEEIVGAYNRRLYGDHPLAEYRVDRQPCASVDAYSLCRPGTLRDWGMAQLVRFNELVGGGYLHIHENSLQVIEEVVEIPGWRLVFFTEGNGWPRPFDLRWELRRRMQDIPIAIPCRREEFMQALDRHDLPGNAQYFTAAESLDEAHRMMERARVYHAPVKSGV